MHYLKVRDYCLGKQLPVFHSAQVTDVKRNDDSLEVSQWTIKVLLFIKFHLEHWYYPWCRIWVSVYIVSCDARY